MWVLKWFLFPTWRGLSRDNVGTHFGIPTKRATAFFTGVVPLMFVAAIILVVTEWGTRWVWFGVACLVGIFVLTFVGQGIIIPINKRIRGGDFADDAELRSLLHRWMTLNDIRFYGSTFTWVAITWYVVARGDLLGALT
nr:anthrone oxygenase family protein [Cellulomonas septica]